MDEGVSVMSEMKRGPGRPRKEPDRRRKGHTGGFRSKLDVNEAHLDRENFEYRFVNDDPGRIQQLHVNDDWEFVEDPSKSVKEDGTDIGSRVSTVVGRAENGQPTRGYLMRKRRDYYEADKAETQARIDRQMKQIQDGPSPEQGGIGTDPASAYRPSEGIRIEEGAKR